MKQTDVLVIGSGAAGLTYAIKVAEHCPDKQITIITKSTPTESNTKYAQGGVAVVLDTLRDNFDQHIADTLRAGDGQCNAEVVKMVVKDAPDRIMELIHWGVNFDLDQSGNFDLGREGGHTHHRVVHHKDNTGEAIENMLLARATVCKNIHILDFSQAIDLLLSHDGKTCIGVSVLDINSNNVVPIKSTIVVLATGGCGHVYQSTTNPDNSTGDGIALAYRAHAKVNNMQFVQFHPTAIYEQTKGQLALISEAVRGAGAKLLNIAKEPFMHKYDERLELASRDIVSRAIHSQMQAMGSKYVYLDCRHIDQSVIKSHFPNIYNDCKSKGIDLLTDLLPVAPASHYLCGGIDVDMDGQSSINNVYAIGECSNTGLHGANRLASNSLLEALVYGDKAAKKTIATLQSISATPTNSVQEAVINHKEIDIKTIEKLKNKLNTLMSKYVGIVRTNNGLQAAKQEWTELAHQFSAIYADAQITTKLEEVRNLIVVSQLIIDQSIAQKFNTGTFYNSDLDEK